MTRHRPTPNPCPAVVAALQAACAAILLTTAAPSPAAAQVAKVQKLPDAYRGDARLVAVVTTGGSERRCIGATVGHFAVLTSYECLADWWNNTAAHTVRFATDPERKYAYEGFSQAWRGGKNSRWAVLETAGHSAGYYGYENLERTTAADVFDFVGFSKKVKNGKQPAIQSRCRLTRVSSGVYTSECGADFGTSAILLLRRTGAQHYVSGLAWVRSEAKVDKRRVFTIETTSLDAYRADLNAQRRDQDARYAAVVQQRQALMAQHRAASAEYEAEAAARAAERSARRRADLEKFGAALGQLAATLGQRGRPVPATAGTLPWARPPVPSDGTRACRHRLQGATLYSQQTGVLPSNGGVIEIQVDVPAGCAWRLDRDGGLPGSWLAAGRLSGSGPGRLTFSAGPFVAQAGEGPDTRAVPYTFRNLSSPDYDHDFRIAQCLSTISLGSCGAGVSTSQ